MIVVLWVNRRSGVAHPFRDCAALEGVPEAALREVEQVEGYPPLRLCSTCAYRAVAGRAVRSEPR
ncbi:MAG: hypothetical protein WD689_02930 [Gaiellaceae bacterium]